MPRKRKSAYKGTCRHGRLKSPYRDPKTGRMRYCKRPKKKRAYKATSKGGCKHGRLKSPVRLPSGGKRYCKKAPKRRRAAA